MRGLLEKLQERIGATASGFPSPALGEVQLNSVTEPVSGWVAKEDFTVPRLGTCQYVLKPLASPRHQQAPLLLLPAQTTLDSPWLTNPFVSTDETTVAALDKTHRVFTWHLSTPEHFRTGIFALNPRTPDAMPAALVPMPSAISFAPSYPALPAHTEPLRPSYPRVCECQAMRASEALELNLARWCLAGPLAHVLGSTCDGLGSLVVLPESSLPIQHDLLPAPFQPAEVTGNMNHPLRPRRGGHVQDCSEWLLPQTLVSHDLHVPLARRPRADGKRYQDKAQRPHGVLSPETPAGIPSGVMFGDRKSFTQERGRPTRGVSIWDLLFPLLQRPLALDFGSVVELPGELNPYQPEAIEFLVNKTAALLGDDMGLGKTVQTAVALRMLFQKGKIRTALIVCPLSVIPNWDRELAKWAGNLAVTVVRGDKEQRDVCWRQAAHVWLVTYDTLRNDIDHVLVSRKGGFDLVALDEAQRVKNWSTGVTRAVRSLRATYRWGLTGTPLENNTEELWTILNVLKPDISQGQPDWSEGIRSVLRPMFLRRRKQDVLTDLPPLVQNPVWLRLEDEQRKSYEKLEKEWVYELHTKWQTEERTAQSALVLIGKLKQVCNRCPRSGESSKLAWLRDSLEVITAEGDKVLVFSQYTDEKIGGANWLESELAEFGALNHPKAKSHSQRKALLAAFKEKPEHKVFVGNPKTTVGLNELVVANYVVHFDHWWNPAVMNQATARAHRRGQTKTVFAYDLWVQETYEEIIYKLLEQKQGLYNEVVDSMSVERKPEDNLAFAVADGLFAKYGLSAIRKK